LGDERDQHGATHHGTAIAIGAAAALILGPSGAGKSDLALRCISLGSSALVPQPCVLVADDRVHLVRADGGLTVSAPSSIAGNLEVRGVGIIAVPHRPSADLVLTVELVAPDRVERMPDPPMERDFLGWRLPLVRLAPFEASAPVKLILALIQASHGHSGRQKA
jgi:serine kinase of HPr protein (carbohydrate metabolism regulator)